MYCKVYAIFIKKEAKLKTAQYTVKNLTPLKIL